MEKYTFTDPFTGISFNALVNHDGNKLIAMHPLTGASFEVAYDPKNDALTIPAKMFGLIETFTLKQAAEFMNVTIQTVSNACKAGTIPTCILPNGEKVIVRSVLEYYNSNKKNGRPKKEAQNA